MLELKCFLAAAKKLNTYGHMCIFDRSCWHIKLGRFYPNPEIQSTFLVTTVSIINVLGTRSHSGFRSVGVFDVFFKKRRIALTNFRLFLHAAAVNV